MSTQIEVEEQEVAVNGVSGNGKVGAQLPLQNVERKVIRTRQSSGMLAEPQKKYRPFAPIDLPDRQWPNRQITQAPIWCSVDLRDGNQALAIPMSIAEKLEMFQTLVQIGFKEIEIGFPAASQTEFDFCRRLIEENRIPDDVTVQVLVQCREELIRRTFEALQGARRAIVHFYNSTNPAQRRIVFGMSRDEIKNIAVNAAKLVKQLAAQHPETQWVAQYSPESFCLTELEYSLEVCEAVVDVWQPTPKNKIILNLPATVESFTPNIHADQIEWFCHNIRERESVTISLHTHNDRGTGVAATELSLMAGADRVEGTLFGNGERTGNVDIVTVALNMYSQGVHPNLDFSDIDEVREVYERTTRLEVPLRQPYAGELVFTAFSGSHQDAINKGMAAQSMEEGELWQVPYLPLDPQDIGRSYEAIIRINSQSGKGGVAYVMEQEFGFQLPKEMRVEFSKVINRIADERGAELKGNEIYKAFSREYLHRDTPLELESFRAGFDDGKGKENVECLARLKVDGVTKGLKAKGNGPINAFVKALKQAEIAEFEIMSYAEHSLGQGAEAKAVAYIQIEVPSKGKFFGAAIDTNIELAGIKAVVSALNRSLMR